MSDTSQVSGDAGRAVLRWAASLHVLALIGQVAMAIAVVGGQAQAYAGHKSNAWGVLALGVLQALAVLTMARSRLSGFFIGLAVIIPAFEGLQFWLGRTVQTPWHVTNGVLIWAAALAILIKAWRPDGLVSKAAAA
jgi:hypothetical protein